MLILVTGLMAYNSGKTVFARALAREMVHRGMAPGVFKPQSAHNYWDHLSHSRRCMELGKLVSRDALELKEASGDATPIEVINPHHQLFCPLDLLKLWEGRPGATPTGEDELLGERMTVAQGPRSTLYINRDSHLFMAEEAFLSALRRGVKVTKPLNPLASREREEAAREAITSCLEAQMREHRHLIVESTNDTALPYPLQPSQVGLVVVMAGNLLLAFEGGDFFRAAKLGKISKVKAFVALSKPKLGYRLPYIPEDERMDVDRVYAHLGTAAAGVLDEALPVEARGSGE